MSISDEFSFIQKITPKKQENSFLIKGIGDDAALFRGSQEVEEVVCMDTMVEGIHFARQTMRPYHIGYKALAANMSDIAAMGGVPTFYLVSIAVPQSWNESDVIEIYRGMKDLAETFHVELIGGDTVSSKGELVVTVTALGRVPKKKYLLRSNAEQGDVVFVTGTLGNAAAGLELLLKHGVDYEYSVSERKLVDHHQMPNPRVEVGKILSKTNRVALNDISDGIASEANEIAEASQVTIILEKEQLPKSKEIAQFPEEDQLNWILNGGEDFELLGTASLSEWEWIVGICKDKGQKITKIGYVKEGNGEVLLYNGGEPFPLLKKGYNHFR